MKNIKLNQRFNSGSDLSGIINIDFDEVNQKSNKRNESCDDKPYKECRQSSLNMMRKASFNNNSNFHHNFRDYSKSSQGSRQDAVKKRANILLKQIGMKMQNQVEELAYKNFKDQVQNGMRLSIQEMKQLKPSWKQLYQTTIMSEDL